MAKWSVSQPQSDRVNGSFYDILGFYLSDRKQIVVVDGQKSDILDVKAGIPQGSRLWPLLFIIYMNDIIENIESDIWIFAEDFFCLQLGQTQQKLLLN